MAENETEGTGRFAGYHTGLARFVGGVHDSKTKAKAAGVRAAKAAGQDAEAIEVREV